MALDIDTDRFRRVGELVDQAGTALDADLGEDVPACGADEVSQQVMGNLNARRRWLAQHIRAGVSQASHAARGINDTATSYEAEDAAAAGRYGHAGGHPSPAAPAMAVPPSAVAAPGGSPAVSAVPDISGRDGEELALALEGGVGTGPAVTAAGRLAGVATQAQAAATALVSAQDELLASGESEAHAPLLARLGRAILWTQAVGVHADALAGGYTTAAGLHTATAASVGPSVGWRTLKNSYSEAVMENQMTGMAQPKVDALQAALSTKQQQSGVAMTGYQSGGETISTSPGGLLAPGLDPNGDSGSGDDPHIESLTDDDGDSDGDGDTGGKRAATGGAGGNSGAGDKDKSTTSDGASGMQDILSSGMGAFGPLAQSLGQANPLQSVGQAAQQLGQQAAKLGGGPAGAGLKPAAFHPAKAGGGGGHLGGGSSPIKPASGISGAVHPASLTGTPASSSAVTPMKPGAATGGATGGAGGAGGMMPLGHKGGGSSKSSRVNSYEQPLPEVDDAGRDGVVGATTATPTPVVNSEAQNAVKARLARRKKDASLDGAG